MTVFKRIAIALATIATLTGATNAEMNQREKAIFTATLVAYQQVCPGRMPGAGTLWINTYKGSFTQSETDLATGLVGETMKEFGGTKAWCSKIKARIIDGLDG
jgi:hypothetical protein